MDVHMSNDLRDSRLSPEVRASALVEQMTLDEKCHQIVGVRPWAVTEPGGSEPTDIDDVPRKPPGHVVAVAGPRRVLTSAQRCFLSEAVVCNA
jgi:hypothetical protein